jgi:hypothetical protein
MEDLIAMGFEESAASGALKMFNYDIDRAVEFLLSNPDFQGSDDMEVCFTE